MRSRLVLTAIVLIGCLPVVRGADDSAIVRLRKDLEYLTSDECEGRGAQTKGIAKAGDYIAAEFKNLGLKPGGTEGYFQPFTMRAGRAVLGEKNSLTLKGPLGQQIELAFDKQFRSLGCSATGSANAPIVFAGYGITTPDGSYDDYKGLDAAGKIVIVLRKAPPVGKDGKPFAGARMNALSSLDNKLVTAARAKAKGVLFVNDREAVERDALMPFAYTAEADPSVDLPSAHVSRSVVDGLLLSAVGQNLKEVEDEICRTAEPRSVPLTGWSAKLNVTVNRPTVTVKNVIGILEGKGPLANEYIVIGAHYDHLGRGERGSLERDAKKKQEFHRGADDNGSGTVSVMELARRFAADKNYQGRSIVFMTFAGEEQGLLGSRHFCNNPTVPMDRIAGMLNLDMVGRLRADKGKTKGKLEVGGVGSAKEFNPIIDELNKKYDFELARTVSAFGPSDHTSFAEKKVPVFFLFTGLHTDYHRPTDTLATINFEGMKKVVDFAADIAQKLGTMTKPAYIATPRSMGPVRGNTPRIGFMPGNYDEATEKGVLVGGVSEGGPAAKAGLREGDFIVEIAGKPVKNMSGYMTVMATLKKGEVVEFVVDRDGKKCTLKVTPE